MLKKRAIKFLIISLCLVLALPIFINRTADAKKVSCIYVPGVEKIIYLDKVNLDEGSSLEDIVTAGNNVKIIVNDTLYEGDQKVIYDYNDSDVSTSYKTDTDAYKALFVDFSFTSSSKKLVMVCKDSDDFTIKITSKVDDTKFVSFEMGVAHREEVESCLRYNTDSTFLAGLQTKINKYAEGLKVGDSFKETGIDDKITIETVDYEQKFADLIKSYIWDWDQSGLSKVIHYAMPGNDWKTYSATGSTNLYFTCSKAGKYLFYITAKTDKVLTKQVNGELSDENCVLKLAGSAANVTVDGMYNVLSDTSDTLYVEANGNEYKYYTDEDKENEYTGNVTYKFVIPVFTFEIAKEEFAVTAPTTEQESGYINSSYSMKGSFTINGDAVTTVYSLYYSANSSTDKTTYECINDNLGGTSFTPENKGYYYIKATSVDVFGAQQSAICGDIVVSSEYKVVKYKTAFGDWIKANTLSFVFACLAFASLVALLLVIFIKPKEKKVEVEEEDK